MWAGTLGVGVIFMLSMCAGEGRRATPVESEPAAVDADRVDLGPNLFNSGSATFKPEAPEVIANATRALPPCTRVIVETYSDPVPSLRRDPARVLLCRARSQAVAGELSLRGFVVEGAEGMGIVKAHGRPPSRRTEIVVLGPACSRANR